MSLKPCIGCGEPSTATHCTDCRPPARQITRRVGTFAFDRTWRRLSTRARRLQPFCLDCGGRDDLTADHIIPVAEAPELAHEPLNITVRCRPCNSVKGDRCTDADRAAVLAAITARKHRAGGRHRRPEGGGGTPTGPAVSPEARRTGE